MTANGYTTDQFFGLSTIEDSASFASGAPNNPPFIYPARQIITQDGQGNVTKQTMQRGYIRTLINSVQGQSIGIRKCAFQFNPQILSTSVQMTQDVLNAYQIDVGQFAVPTAGNSNFLFQLFFDRSMELNNGPGHGDTVTGDPNTTNIFSGAGALSPAAIGVFRDIGELNAIIGAGLSAEELLFAQQTAVNQIKAQATSTGTALTDTSVVNAINNVPNVLGNVNFGNTAFLIPQPVRAVFSSLFMVEGFVTNIDINYTKFTTTMVPMQATVTLTMNAQYIGYAKKKTYVTDSLDKQAQAFQDQQQAVQDTINGLASALQSSAGSVRLGMGVFDSNSTIAPSPLSGAFGVIEPSAGFTPNLFVFSGAPTALNATQTSVKDSDPVAVFTTNNAGDSFGFSTIGTVSIFGPYTTSRASTTSSFNDAAHLVFYGLVINTGATWKDIAVPFTSVGTDPLNQTYYTSANVGAAALDGSKYWVIKLEVQSNVAMSGGAVTGSGSKMVYTKDLTTILDFAIPMRWTTPVVPGIASTTSGTTTVTSTAPSVAASNVAVNAQSPGSSSSIGVKLS